MPDLPERRKNDQRLAALERKVSLLQISSWVKYAIMLALVVFVVVKWSDRSDRIEGNASVAKAAATTAKRASAVTRKVVRSNTELIALTRRNARVANKVATQLNKAVCAWQDDLQKRIEGTEEYLKTHPQGFPGVPLQTLLDSLRNQKRTARAFGGLDCLRAG